MKRERTYREQLRGTYHYVLTRIAMHLADPDVKPTTKQIAAIKDYFRARFHLGRSTEDLSDQELSDLINEVEADAAGRLLVTFPARRTRDMEPTACH